MKKKWYVVLAFLAIIALFTSNFALGKVKTLMQGDRPEKIEDARLLLDKIIDHIDKDDNGLSASGGKLYNSELGLPLFEIVGLSEIRHFDNVDYEDGTALLPTDNVDNPKMIVIAKGKTKEIGNELIGAMAKVESDQFANFANGDIVIEYLLDEGKTVKQGYFVLYAVWDNVDDLVKIFQKYVQ